MQDLLRLFRILTPRARREMGGLVLLCTLSGLVEAAGVAMTIPFMAAAANASPFGMSGRLERWGNQFLTSLGIPQESTTLALGVLLLAGLGLANALICLYQYYAIRLIQRQNAELSIRVVESCTARSLDWYDLQNSADLSQSVMSEVANVVVCSLFPAVQLLAIGIRLMLLSLLFLVAQPRLALLISFALGVSYFLIVHLLHKPLLRAGAGRVEAIGRMYKTSSDIFQGAREIQVTGSGGYFVSLFESAARATIRPQVVRAMPAHLTRAGLELSTIATVVVILIYFHQLDGNLANGLPILSAYAIAGVRIMPALQQAVNYWMEMRFHIPAVQRLEGLLEAPAAPAQDEPLDWQRSIELRNVSFRYPDTRHPSIRDISLSIEQKTRVAIVGVTGAGKSTLMDILLGLRFPQTGQVLVDGRPLTQCCSASWRRKIGYVPQNIYLLDASIRENVAFGHHPDEIDPERVKRACEAASVHDFIVGLPQGYDSLVGERGTRLSGGQCQRLAIARALYREPELVMFDEATSSLDNVTENAVLEAIHALKGKKTLAVVAHRLNTVWDFDKIFVLQDGLLVGEGTSAELSENCPAFQELIRFQTKPSQS